MTAVRRWVGAPRRQPRQERGQATVGRILAAARALAEREGSAGFNTNRIADQAGTAVGTLYEYFPDKESIARAVLESLAEAEARAIIDEIDRWRGVPLRVALAPTVRAVFRLHREHAAARIGLEPVAAPDRAQVGRRAAEQRIMATLADRLKAEALTEVTDPVLAAEIVFHTVEAVAFHAARRPGTAFAEAAEQETIRIIERYLGL